MKKRISERILERLLGRINPEEEVKCTYVECLERGEHLICLYDKFPRCDIYIKYKKWN